MEQEQLKLLDDTKFMIRELSKIQEHYFDILLDTLDLVKKKEDWVFDYIFNHTDEKSFTEYLEDHGKKLSDICHE